MTLNTWLSSLRYAQTTSLQRSRVRAEMSGMSGEGRGLACGAGRNTELGTSGASSQMPFLLTHSVPFIPTGKWKIIVFAFQLSLFSIL